MTGVPRPSRRGRTAATGTLVGVTAAEQLEDSRAADPARLPAPGHVPAGDVAWRVLGALPEVVPAALAGLVLAGTALLLAGAFRPGPLLVAGALAAAALGAAAALPMAPLPRGHRVPALLALALVVAVGAAGAALSAEDVVVERDPAIYTVAGRWLVTHPDLDVSTPTAVYGDVPGLDPGSPGFFRETDTAVTVQGMPGLPVLLAAAGSVAGDRGLLGANGVLAAAAPLALFGLARRLTGSGWAALAAAGALAVSLPFTAFARAPYTEPLTAAFLLAALALLARVLTADDAGAGRLRLAATAGAVGGAAVLLRVDAWLVLLPLVVLAPLTAPRGWAHRGRHRAPRRWRGALAAGAPRDDRASGDLRPPGAVLVAVALPAAAGAALGLAALARYGGAYLRALGGELALLAGATAVAAAGALAAVTLARRRPAWTAALAARRRGLALAAALAVAGGAALLASRPLWLVARRTSPAGQPELAAFQASLGLPVDPTRSYDELSLSWVAWYFGWPAVVAAALGLALLVHRAVARPEPRLAPALAVVLAAAAVYLVFPGIFPDQVWAVRRLLPLVVPGLLLGLAATLASLTRRGRAGGLAAALLGLAVVGQAAAVTLPLAPERELVGQLAQVRATCAALGPDAALLLPPEHPSASYVQTLRTWCGVPVQTAADLSPAVLAPARRSAEASGRRLLVGRVVQDAGTGRPEAAPPDDSALVDARALQRWERRLLEPPREPTFFEREVWLAEVTPAGGLRPADLPG